METDILIIGGGPAGLTVAMTARANYPDKRITIVRKDDIAMIPCGIPYIFGTLKKVEKNKINDEILAKNNIQLIIDEVIDVDVGNKIARLRNDEIKYEKLVLATGSLPSLPKIEGYELKNVFGVYKNASKLQEMLSAIDEVENVVIIGGGFIGVEFADELAKAGKKVSIVEILPHLLYLSFDDEFCAMAEEKLKMNGVSIYTGKRVKRIEGNESVEGVTLEDGSRLDADVVIMATGAKPNTELAEKMGLKTSKYGIDVDEYMRTSMPDIFAVGDCAAKRCFFTRRHKPIMLASIATAEARVAGSNLYSINSFRNIFGTLGIFSTKIGDLTLGAAGLIERMAEEEGFKYIVGESKVDDKHPSSLPGTRKIKTKLLFSNDGFMIGGQIAGGDTVGEIINLIGFAIETKMTAPRFANLQIGTHPLLTPPPTAPATLKAVEDAIRKIYRSDTA